MKTNIINKKSGFTILEMLVSVAVIGVLLALVIVSTRDTREKSNDVRRISDVKQISNALNLYVTDRGIYPISTTEIDLTGNDTVSRAITDAGSMPVVPQDPLYPAYSYKYQTNAEGTTYVLKFCLQTNTISGYTQNCNNTIKP